MVRVISQETFNEAVRENVDDLGMPLQEAIEEAIKQFEAQSVDLSNIAKKIMKDPADVDVITNAIKRLQNFNKSKKSPKEYNQLLAVIREQCDKGLEYKVVAGKEGAYEEILNTLTINKGVEEVETECLKTFIALMSRQPDLLNDEGFTVILSYVNPNTKPEVAKLCLKWAKECCVLHEMNRRKFYEDHNIVDNLKPLIEDPKIEVLPEVLGLLRALVLDDDVRVEFGRGPEHARGIANEMLCSITNLLSKFKEDELVISDLVLTLSTLLVRSEFCKKVADVGGVTVLKDVMVNFLENEKINRQCFKLLKALAGNDECKVDIIESGLAPIIGEAMLKHKSSALTVAAGLGCIAALTLRCANNSKILFESSAPEIIIEVMNCHPREKCVQKTGSWAIRNMVSRSKYQTAHFLELGAEDTLKQALKSFTDCEYDVKAALRDLECEVDFKEEWTGKGGLINTDAKRV